MRNNRFLEGLSVTQESSKKNTYLYNITYGEKTLKVAAKTIRKNLELKKKVHLDAEKVKELIVNGSYRPAVIQQVIDELKGKIDTRMVTNKTGSVIVSNGHQEIKYANKTIRESIRKLSLDELKRMGVLPEGASKIPQKKTALLITPETVKNLIFSGYLDTKVDFRERIESVLSPNSVRTEDFSDIFLEEEIKDLSPRGVGDVMHMFSDQRDFVYPALRSLERYIDSRPERDLDVVDLYTDEKNHLENIIGLLGVATMGLPEGFLNKSSAELFDAYEILIEYADAEDDFVQTKREALRSEGDTPVNIILARVEMDMESGGHLRDFMLGIRGQDLTKPSLTAAQYTESGSEIRKGAEGVIDNNLRIINENISFLRIDDSQDYKKTDVKVLPIRVHKAIERFRAEYEAAPAEQLLNLNDRIVKYVEKEVEIHKKLQVQANNLDGELRKLYREFINNAEIPNDKKYELYQSIKQIRSDLNFGMLSDAVMLVQRVVRSIVDALKSISLPDRAIVSTVNNIRNMVSALGRTEKRSQYNDRESLLGNQPRSDGPEFRR